MLLIQHILDILYKNDKLRHAFPPIKIQQYKKQNAKPYDFKENYDYSVALRRMQEAELKRKGIVVSESTKKKKRVVRIFNDKSLDVIQQNIL